MQSVTFPGGISIGFPEDWVLITPAASEEPVVRRTRRPLPVPPKPTIPEQENWLAKAVASAGLQLLSTHNFEPVVTTTPKQDGPFHVSMRLAEREDAMILCEQNGWYVWKGAESAKAPSADGTIHIEVPIGGQNNRSLRREKFSLHLFKFALQGAPVSDRPRVEVNIAPRIIHVRTTAVDTWKSVVHLSDIQSYAVKTPHILLLIHGSFSSTRHTFGVLGVTPWGKSMLASAIQHYDAVLGFDHPTLVDDPLKNAEQLLDLLTAREWPVSPTIDVIVHGRGALVIRCLLEMLLPKHPFKADFRRVIFVGAANEGIDLAAPGNWERLAALYTNLIGSAERAAKVLAPPHGLDTAVFAGPLQRVVELLRYCKEVRAEARQLNGLLSIQTGSELVRLLNETQDGQPSVENCHYCAITTAFRLTAPEKGEPREFPAGLLAELITDYNVSEGAHDLLVATATMDAIDRTTGTFIKERYDFEENAQVYHTNYFTRPEVANALARWLMLPPVETGAAPSNIADRPAERVTRGTKPAHAHAWPLNLTTPSSFGEPISPYVDTDIICFDASAPASALQSAIRSAIPSWVVVKQTDQGVTSHYAFKGEEALNKLQGDLNQPVKDSFGLNNLQVSGMEQLHTGSFRQFAGGGSGPGTGGLTGQRRVVLHNKIPVGIVPEPHPLPDIDQLAKTAKIITAPQGTQDHILQRRTMPTFTSTGAGLPSSTSDPTLQPPTQQKDVLCHFRADMDAEVIVKRVSTIIVTISREAIAAAIGMATDAEEKPVRSDEKLFIRVMPRSKFVLIDGQDGRKEVDVPAPGKPLELPFECRAIEEGAGEIWVLISQGAVSILKLVLRPQAVLTRTKVSSINADAAVGRPAPLKHPLHQLRIEEANNAEGVYYKYFIYSQELGLSLDFKSDTIKGDRKAYIASLYDRIEQCWARSAEDKYNFKEELRAFGAQLFEELIPRGLQEILWTRRNTFGSIQVVSDEPFIPWELVHLREPGTKGMPDETLHLAQIGLVRWLAGAGENGWPPQELNVKKGRFRYVIPEYPIPEWQLPQAQIEKTYLEKQFNAVPVNPISGDVRGILSKPGQFDILHFACHGESPVGQIWSTDLQMQGRKDGGKYKEDRLNAVTVEQFANLGGTGQAPMIFLNACQTGREGYSLTKISGFAGAFLTRGACAFIAAAWSIGDLMASDFTKTFYERLQAGDILSVAADAARAAIRESGDATWLAYVVYGHPHLQLSFE